MLFSCTKKDEQPEPEPEPVPAPAPNTPATPVPTVTTEEPKVGTEIGFHAPDFVLNDSTGKPVHLSDLRGKLVLIDFWADWCGPCIEQNKLLIDIYKEFKDKQFRNGQGFEILSVSIDVNEAAWKKRIRTEGYTWPTHVRDPLRVVCKQYSVPFIPSNWLVDGDGVIIARDLLDEKVEKELNFRLK